MILIQHSIAVLHLTLCQVAQPKKAKLFTQYACVNHMPRRPIKINRPHTPLYDVPIGIL